MDLAIDGILIGSGLNATLYEGATVTSTYKSGAIRGSALRMEGYQQAASLGKFAKCPASVKILLCHNLIRYNYKSGKVCQMLLW